MEFRVTHSPHQGDNMSDFIDNCADDALPLPRTCEMLLNEQRRAGSTAPSFDRTGVTDTGSRRAGAPPGRDDRTPSRLFDATPEPDLGNRGSDGDDDFDDLPPVSSGIPIVDARP